MNKQISTVIVAAALASLTACGSAPTASGAATPGEWQADAAPADTSGRVPNMMGSGN